MNTSTKIISVNPGRDTLGVLNGKHLEIAVRFTGVTSEYEKGVEDPVAHVCRMLFAGVKVSGRQSWMLLAGRLVAAAALFFAAAPIGGAASVVLYCLIPLLVFGFLTRPAALAGALVAGVGSLAAGLIAAPAMIAAIAGCTLFMVTGAGRISIDRSVMRTLIRKRRNQMLTELL